MTMADELRKSVIEEFVVTRGIMIVGRVLRGLVVSRIGRWLVGRCDC